eukprot:TRINITY_DN20248_c0_g1_i1.p1 TRINITY_DN20248_c0_g1~~TRINITY_DN20248_c0_g1_i1.p1  ORF type:complete len:327 (-),score=47.04 TRINITY_DN20248_c0_g1_i1:179-1159(-)
MADAVGRPSKSSLKQLSPEWDTWAEDASACAICKEKIGKLTRPRHHCRVCGLCVCSSCSPNSIMLEGFTRPQRACTQCVAGISNVLPLTERLASLYRSLAPLVGEKAQKPQTLGEAAALCEAIVEPIERAFADNAIRVDMLEDEVAAAEERAQSAKTDLEMERRARAYDEGELVKMVEALGDKINTVARSSRWFSQIRMSKEKKKVGTVEDAIAYCEESLEQIKLTVDKPSRSSLTCSTQENTPEFTSMFSRATQGPSPPEWEVNSTRCRLCDGRIGKRFLKRRHHCRLCGRCVCSPCSPGTAMVAGHKGPQRACIVCLAQPRRTL